MKFLLQMFLPLPNRNKLLLVIWVYLLGQEWIFPGAWSQENTTILKYCLGLQMFLVLNFPLTTRASIFFSGTCEWIHRTHCIIVICWLIYSASCCWLCHGLYLMMFLQKSIRRHFSLLDNRRKMVGAETHDSPVNPNEGAATL